MSSQPLPTLVATNFFPAFSPPRSGGEQRYFHLYEHLSRRFDVTLVSANYPDRAEELVEHSATFREFRVPKAGEANALHWTLDQQGIGPECSGYVVALCGAFDGAFGRRLRACIAGADIVVHESPFTVPYDHGIGLDGVPRIYNAYNVEADLAFQMLHGAIGAEAAAFIADLERFLLLHCDRVFATSEAERQRFSTLYGFDATSIELVPNGFEEAAIFADRIDPSSCSVVFLGSQHPPNIEALEFIADTLAPGIPDVVFDILGGVCNGYRQPVPANVRLHGFVAPERKSELLANALAAINPLFSGAGTNLKMLDYMAHGAPIVTTPVGARGLELVNGHHALISAAGDFAKSLAALTTDRDLQAALGTEARELARSRYSWHAIAGVAGDAIERLLVAKNRTKTCRRKIVWLCDYPVHRPEGGGQVRLNRLARQIGMEFDVVLICLSDSVVSTTRYLASGVRQIEVPISPAHRAELEASAAGEWISIADVVASRHCLRNQELVETVRLETCDAHAVVFEQCFLSPLLDCLPSGLPVVYSSQNCEALLKAGLLQPRADALEVIDEVVRMETCLLKASAVTICVSAPDALHFAGLLPSVETVVVANGVDVPDAPPERIALVREPLAVFVGSGHPPNVQAAYFIRDVLAPATPDVTYALVGSVCSALARTGLPANVQLLGFLSDEEKALLLAGADIAVNPLFEGGGSSLKVADFFASGLATVSSAVGMRGYDVTEGVHYIRAEADEFVGGVRALLSDPGMRQSLGEQSRRFASENLDWRILAGKFRRHLRRLVSSRDTAPRALVLTYRFGGAPRGGAEVFLLETLHRIAEADRWKVDVAACDVGSIFDVHMFSAMYGPREPADMPPAWAGQVNYFPLDPLPDTTMVDCRALHVRWIQESRELGMRFASQSDEPLCAGGWHGPEGPQHRPSRWMSREALLRLPSDVTRLALELHAPVRTEISAWASGNRLDSQTVFGDCRVDLQCSGHDGIVSLHVDNVYEAPGDARELGVRVTAVYIMRDGAWSTLDMRRGLEALAEVVGLEAWTSALIETAENRPEEFDRKFLSVRGPISTKLTQWLDSNVARYDVLMVQGVPFRTSVEGVQAANRAGVPVIVLPHVHLEDRYYHWRCFYDAFRHADRVIAAPRASIPLYFSKVGGRAVALPGGGVNLVEFGPDAIGAARDAFRQLHSSTAPFVLVLGRKAGAKNYRTVLDACTSDQVREAGVEVVMIGPDDDGQPLEQNGVHYLGRQPRNIVIGALAEALCLANMSSSESFGIVLLEAWLADTPVVVNRNCQAFAELVDDARNGRLVTNAAELADAVLGYAGDRVMRQRHASAGHKLAATYDWSVLADCVTRLWDELVDAVPSAVRDTRTARGKT